MQVKLKDVTYQYKTINKKIFKAIDNISLEIDENSELIFLLGHTGSGKSTLVQHLNMLLSPTSGDVDILGINKQKNFLLKDVRRNVGMVFQFSEYQLFEESVIKDVMFGPSNFGISKEEALINSKKALDMVLLDESFYERSPFSLSGGEMRKVAIAGVLAYDPKILVLDEPTVGLDLKSQKQIMEVISDLVKVHNKTVIIVSHNMDLVLEYAKRVIVLNSSKLVYDGDVLELFKNEKLLEESKLDLPRIIAVSKEIKEKLNIDIDVYQRTREGLVEELERFYGNDHR